MKRPLIYINRKQEVKKQGGGGVRYISYGLAPTIPAGSDAGNPATGVVGYDSRMIDGTIKKGWVVSHFSTMTRLGQAFPFNAVDSDVLSRFDYIGKIYSRVGVVPTLDLKIDSNTTFYVVCETNYMEEDTQKTNGLIPYKFTLNDEAFHFTYATEEQSDISQLKKVRLCDDVDRTEDEHINLEAFKALYRRIKTNTYQVPGYKYDNGSWTTDSRVASTTPRNITLGRSLTVIITNQSEFSEELVFDNLAYNWWRLLPLQQVVL